jgi:uncharacterized membrane protein
MTDKNYLEDLNEIKDLMNKSSKFMSLSGLSGILAGTYALIGAYIANGILQENTIYLRLHTRVHYMTIFEVLGISGIVLLLSVGTGIFLSRQKAKKNNEKLWNAASKNLLFSFLIPLATGAIFGLILLKHEHFGVVAPVSLIFYGLALINSSKYTFGTVKYLGISEVIIGLIAAYFPGNGLLFWALGFGVLHIIYGVFMYLKFDRK